MTGSDGWKPIAEAAGQRVLSRRVELGHRTRGDFAAATGLTIKTLGEIERGARPSYNRNTYATIDNALGWDGGTFERLLTASPGAPEPSWLSTPEGIARHIHRDDLPLVALLHRAGLTETDLFKLILHVRAVREKQNADLLGDVATRIRDLGGHAPDVPYPPVWLMEDEAPSG